MKHITYEYPCASIKNLVVTNDRGTAARYIEKGYDIFSVPQMFGQECGVIVLYAEEFPSTKKNGMEILKSYEDDARSHAFGGSPSPSHTNASH